MARDGSKRFGKTYMTGGATAQYVHWKCAYCGAEGQGYYNRPPKKCRTCKHPLFWEDKDPRTGKMIWVKQ